MPQLGLHTGAGHHCHSAAIGHQRTGEHHVLAVAQSHIFLGDHIGGLFHRLAFAGEGAFVDLHRIALQNPGIGGDEVAGLQQQDITGHHFWGGHLHLEAAPEQGGSGGAHGLERFQRLFRLEVLHSAQHGIEDQHRKDDQRAFALAGQDGDHRSGDEDPDDEILELVEEDLQRSLFLALGELVLAIALQTVLGFLRRKAGAEGGIPVQNLILGQIVIRTIHIHGCFSPFFSEGVPGKKKKTPRNPHRLAEFRKVLLPSNMLSGVRCQPVLAPGVMLTLQLLTTPFSHCYQFTPSTGI